MNRISLYALLSLCVLISFSCEEKLPNYLEPERVLAIKVDVVEQLADRIAPPQSQAVRIKLVGENVYDEVFYDSVDIRGTITISWPRKPGRTRTITLNEKDFLDRNLINNRKMMILPGQQFGLQLIWNMKGDDSAYFPVQMDYARAYLRGCGKYLGADVICSYPEDMIVEGQVGIFKNLHPVSVSAFEFKVVGRAMVFP